ncbi:MAG: hypothetical protein ACYSOI_05820 [Planctomycetota bacterium]
MLILVAGSCFCLSSAAYLFVKFALRPKDGQEWENHHWDFEDDRPEIKRYYFWSKILFSAVIISMLLLFLMISSTLCKRL